MFRIASIAVFLLYAAVAHAQTPAVQSVEELNPDQSVMMTPYRETVEPLTTVSRQRRPWDRPSREVAVPRQEIRRREARPARGWNRGRNWEDRAYMNPWIVAPRYDRYRRPVMCTGPYLAWIGRVQVFVPGSCF